MKYKVADITKLAKDSILTLYGVPVDLKNGGIVENECGVKYEVLSVAMVDHKNPSDILSSTTIMLKGDFKGIELIA